MQKTLLLLAGIVLACASVAASEKSSRADAPVVTAAAAAPGHGGYVHFFLLTRPDDILEMLVGIELADQRIAWSFPELGVTVEPFIASGRLAVNGRFYEVRHLYGIRPYPDDASMQALREDLTRRIVPWIDDATPYCDLRPPAGELCVSCLGFVMRILFPGPTPLAPALPSDFRRVGPDAYYTTEDLLLYLVGLHDITTREARLRRIGELDLPASLREEAIRLVNASDPDAEVAVAASVAPPHSITGKARARMRSLSRTRQPAPRPSKTL